MNAAYNPVGEKRLTSSQRPHLGTLPRKAGEDFIVPATFLLGGSTRMQGASVASVPSGL